VATHPKSNVEAWLWWLLALAALIAASLYTFRH
jgi:hypothetical protein